MMDWLSDWMDLLRCPAEGSRLDLAPPPAGSNGHAPAEALLRCGQCGRGYPVTDGIVRCVVTPEDFDGDRDAKQIEMQARDADAGGYDRYFTDRTNAIEIPPCLEAMRPGPEDVVVELGCGTGRLTTQFAPHVGRVVALDFSLKSLQVLCGRLGPELRKKCLLIQADICAPPLAARAFTKAVSFIVLHHLPTARSRQRAAEAVARLLAPGGTFTCSVYHWSKGKRRDAARGVGDYTQKEGRHSSSIYYYNFETHDLSALLEEAGLRVDLLRGLLIGSRGFRFLGPLVVPVNRLLSGADWGIAHSHYLLARGRAS